jgi:hypothetical protein
VELKDAKLKGDMLTFTAGDAKYTAKVEGSNMTGKDEKEGTLTMKKS